MQNLSNPSNPACAYAWIVHHIFGISVAVAVPWLLLTGCAMKAPTDVIAPQTQLCNSATPITLFDERFKVIVLGKLH